LELIYHPPYPPDLHPTEKVWNHLRYHATHNVYFETLQIIENAIISYLKEHAKPNERLKSLCCIKQCVYNNTDDDKIILTFSIFTVNDI
jgi:transposase